MLQSLRKLFRSSGEDGASRVESDRSLDTDRVLEDDNNTGELSLRAEIERLVDASVHDFSLYERALTHRSVLRGQADSHLFSNERLEFLGDAVLGFVVAEDLYARFPDKNEGFLTRLRAKLVNGSALAGYALNIGLDRLVLMSGNMEQTGGRRNETILADAFEAVIGAIYLDLGLETARRFIHRTMLEVVDLTDLASRRDNFKSLLLEYAQAHGQPQPTYRVVAEEGPSHEKVFTVEVLIGGVSYGTGSASSKKTAEQNAARKALRELQNPEESAG